jgi:hypothetical protein
MTRLRIAVAIGFAICFGLALAGARPAYAAPRTDACVLVTPAQVSAVLGVTVGPGEHIVPSSTTLCGFGSAGATKRVVVAILTTMMFAGEKHPLAGIKEETLGGVGDDAHYMTTRGFGTGLSVLKGGFAFKIRVYGFAVEQIQAKEKTLAQEVLAKL